MECVGLHLKQDVKKYEHSDRISDRRKALFPVDDDDSDSDLGPMSPLSDVSSSFVCDFDLIGQHSAPLPSGTVHDYIIFKNDVETCATQEKSPMQNNSDTSQVCYETPIKESPTKNLKTPHESSNTTVKLPRIPRKNNSDFSCADIDLDVHGDSMCAKNSRVRTALFPESGLTLPARSFYSTSENSRYERAPKNYLTEIKTAERKSKPAPLYLCNRRAKTKRHFGQINAGVRHNIRKPKQKKISTTKILRKALDIIDTSPLNNYLGMIESQCKSMQEPIATDGPKNGEEVKNSAFDPPSEPDEEDIMPDPSKKFFKSTRMRGIVTVNKNIKLQVSKGKINLIQNRKAKRRESKIKLDASDLTVSENNQLLPGVNIANILSMLEDDKENHQACNSSLNSAACNDRKRKHSDQTSESAELLLSPTSQMCDMASGLAINSPKRAKLNITKILDTTTDNVFNKAPTTQDKLFPIFYPSSKPQVKTAKPNNNNNKADPKQWKPQPKDQLLLDAGQKHFGTTQCPECETIYNMGDPNDEIMHLNYHNAAHILRFYGWKHENVVVTNKGDRIIKVSPGDPKVWWKKVNDLMEVVNRDLGFCEVDLNPEKSTVFLYIKNKFIAGCLVAQPKTHAHMMLPNLDGVDICSEESYPVKCGISHIWVAQGHRKQGIGTVLLNSLRMNYMLGYILRNEDIAFSSPTEMGKEFATKYFKTANYFIYTS